MLNSALCCWNLWWQPVHVIPASGIFHISWSWRVGLFPWHFAVCSVHFAQQLILFLPLPVGLSSSHTWDGAVAELLWLTLCLVSQREMESVTSKELTQSPDDEKWFWLSGLILCYFSSQKESVAFSSSAGWFLWFRKQGEVKNWREFYVPSVLMLLQSLLVARKEVLVLQDPWSSYLFEVLIYLKMRHFIRKESWVLGNLTRGWGPTSATLPGWVLSLNHFSGLPV